MFSAWLRRFSSSFFTFVSQHSLRSHQITWKWQKRKEKKNQRPIGYTRGKRIRRTAAPHFQREVACERTDKSCFTNTWQRRKRQTESSREQASKRERYNWKEAHYSTVTRRVERVEITRVAGNLSRTRATDQPSERTNECERTWPRSAAGSTCARSTNYYFWSGNEYRVLCTACMCMRPLYVPATCFVQRPWTRRSYWEPCTKWPGSMDLDVAIFPTYNANVLVHISWLPKQSKKHVRELENEM